MKKSDSPLIGYWKITWMEMWDQDYVDEIVPGHVTIGASGACRFQFGVVEGGFGVWSGRE